MTKISVIGTGTMGSGIAQSALSSGFEVTMVAHSDKSAAEAKAKVEKGFSKAVMANAISQKDVPQLLQHLKVSSSIQDISGSEIVIEAVSENFDVKKEVLSAAEKYAGGCIIATNTSSIPISKLAEALNSKDRFVGIHFFNPVPVMKVVELVKGEHTSEETLSKARSFVEKLGKAPIDVLDFPGFIANRLLMLFINEAANLLDKGIATKEGIDTIVKLGLHHPMGPFELADFIGLDVCNDIMLEIYNRTYERNFKPAESISKLVKEGALGRKSGKGFYNYQNSN
ncbi:MAG: 3-hydroxyacyl-CoA dehydrogenase family protein [Candidatus Micrarchaeaceae archaeon]